MTVEQQAVEKLARALTALRQTRRSLEDLQERQHAPIAIVGMSCRYPGGVTSPQALWELVDRGGDGIGEFPTDRGWNLQVLYNADRDHPGTTYMCEGGFLYDAAGFDHDFFAISPREALAMDPQQRLLLEAAWEAIEHAAIDPRSLRGTATGVFVGVSSSGYAAGSFDATSGLDGHLLTGNTASVAAGRVAYTFGLEGPTFALDTACSSSLVAIDNALLALRSERCPLALAGGVTIIASPGALIEFCAQGVSAADGRCKSFSALADGAGWSEGVGMLLLERLSDAQRNGHPIFGVLRGSAVNHDGASNGLTAPNGPSQQRVISQALADAGLDPDHVDAIEAHGTGTALGDPIEAQALVATYGPGRDRPLWLGSLKSNIGHSVAAAGVGSVIKMVQAIRHQRLPRTLHSSEPSTQIDWDAGPLELLDDAREWPTTGEPRRAAISSFGISGTNAHLIVEEAPAPSTGSAQVRSELLSWEACPPDTAPLLLSARTPAALAEQAARLRDHLDRHPQLDHHDVAATLATGRAHLDWRAAITASDHDHLLAQLAALACDAPHDGVSRGRAREAGTIAFTFPGQGCQWRGMGVELADHSQTFAASLARCADALSEYVEWSLHDVLGGVAGAPSLDRVEVLQPALFAVMVSLAELWRAAGVHPDLVIGHSQGEIAAAAVCGALSLEDAARVSALRAQALAKLSGHGGMVAIALQRSQAEHLLRQLSAPLALAAVNGPQSMVISGAPDGLDQLRACCKQCAIRFRTVAVDYASHSAQVEAIRDELITALQPITPRQSDIPLYSTLTGEPIDTTHLDAEYWYRSLREPVRFEAATRAALTHGTQAFIEITPHPVLALALAETIDTESPSGAERACVLGTLRREDGGARRFAQSLSGAHVIGVEVSWEAVFAGSQRQSLELPTYPFQRQRHWLERTAAAGDLTAAGQTAADHPLLGAQLRLAEEQGWVFTGRLSLNDQPWLADHALFDTPLLPGSGLVELALAVGARVGAEHLEELTLQAPLTLGDDGAVDIQVSVTDPADGHWQVAIHSRPADSNQRDDSDWTRHAEGRLASAANVPRTDGEDTEWPPPGAEPLDVGALYERLADSGYHYGPAFQVVAAAWRDGEDVFAELTLDGHAARDTARFSAHPVLLDAALHATLATTDVAGEMDQRLRLPFAFTSVRVHGTGASSWRVHVSSNSDGTVAVRATDEHGVATVTVDALRSREVDPRRFGDNAPARQPQLIDLRWEPLAAAADRAPTIMEVDADPASLSELSGAASGVLLCRVTSTSASETNVIADIHQMTGRILGLLQAFLGEERFADATLALVTEHAAAVSDGEVSSLVQAPLLGLVRSAQLEHPGRLVLIDSDGSERSSEAIARGVSSGEPQLAIRDGQLFRPHLAVVPSVNPEATLKLTGTVLITGGTGTLGALTARHLAEHHDVTRIILTSRADPDDDRATKLTRELAMLDVEARVLACDVCQRSDVEALLQGLGDEQLSAVIHAAGVSDDGTLGAIDSERLDRVLAPKVDGALHLHELTRGMDLDAFVLFSSAAATVGSAGQANYAAANGFLDALAQYRHTQGLPAHSIAWGIWGEQSRLTAEVTAEDPRLGGQALETAQALMLFDRTLARREPVTLALALNRRVLRAQARAGVLPGLLGSLVGGVRRRVGGGEFVRRLSGVGEGERFELVVGLVCGEAAAILGYESGVLVERDRAFRDLGFDSLTAVELRNRLASVTGLRLAASLVFDYPSCAAVAGYLCERLEGESARVAVVPVRRVVGGVSEPIAIVGMSCRFPGGVRSPQELWDLVASGTDAISLFPDGRGWDREALFDLDPDQPGTTYTREGGFIHDADLFDAAFFSISPREALMMDPQQRLLLEGTWEALESAGIDPESLRGSRTGVWTGVMTHDYGAGSATARREGFDTASLGGSVVSGRVSYTFGFEGPSITVDTACSSSLVALHQACQALRAGECDLALAGGVTVMATPGMFLFFSRQRGLATDGRCKAFAATADGAGFSDGAGLLLVERLSDAEHHNRQILAIVRGSAVNQDGASNGLTAPNGPSQERVILEALANAGLHVGDVDVVEGHGTGTALGDPIEAQAVLATYGQERRDGPLRLGSLKSNIGHTQGAAGVAGVIKMVQALRHDTLPKSLHIDEPSPYVDWTQGEVRLLSEHEPWPVNGHPRRAGISSFGASGTNAHLIVEESPQPSPRPATQGDTDRPLFGSDTLPFLLSAKTEPALREQAQRLHEHLANNPQLNQTDIAHTLTNGRAQLPHRAVIITNNQTDLLTNLHALATNQEATSTLTGRIASGATAFMFTGQGAQRPGMGRELYPHLPVFARAFDEQCEAFAAHLELPLRDIVFAEAQSPEAALLERTEYTQPALFAIEVALYRALEALGVTPDILIGHSIGELTAAHLAGVFSLTDAVALVAARGRLMGALPEGGAMLAIQASEEELTDVLDSRLSLAAINGPNALVVSGESDGVDALEVQWRERGRKVTRLRVSHAFHSALMDPMLEDFRAVAEHVTFSPSRLPVISNLTGQPAGEDLQHPGYWVDHARHTVRFAQGVEALTAHGVTRWIEVGPDSVLTAMARATLDRPGQPAPAVLQGTMRARRSEPRTLLALAAAAHTSGVGVDWGALWASTPAAASPIALPTYPFQRQRFWMEPDRRGVLDAQAPLEHPLLEAVMRLPDNHGWLYSAQLTLQAQPWLADHALGGRVIAPAACLLELALAAARHIEADTIDELTLERPLTLDSDQARAVQLTLSEADDDGRHALGVYSRPAAEADGEWLRHATGSVSHRPLETPVADDGPWPPPSAEQLDSDAFYERLAEEGYHYGPAFQGLRRVWRTGDTLHGEISLDDAQTAEASHYTVHPALLDAALQLLLHTTTDVTGSLSVPFTFRAVRVTQPGLDAMRARISTTPDGAHRLTAGDSNGREAVSIEAVIARPIDPGQLQPRLRRDQVLFSVAWERQQPTILGGVGEAVALVGEFPPEVPGDRFTDLDELTEAITYGNPPPRTALLAISDAPDSAEGVRAGTQHTLDMLQRCLGDPCLADTRFAVVTRNAVRISDERAPGLAAAAVWGLVRSAQAEHPGRLTLIDIDGREATWRALATTACGALAQVALREGIAHLPTLAPPPTGSVSPTRPLDREGTVLITGGTGGLGALVADDLARQGVSRLLLVSRRGPASEGAGELQQALREQGCQAHLVACDTSDRDALKRLLDGIPTEHPLTAVIHAAGVRDDGLITSLNPQRLATVLAPKVDGAIYLDELTAGAPLAEFVLFSSLAATLGGPGQASYAAANAALDALAARRASEQRPASSVAFGPWATTTGMTATLSDADRRRWQRLGISPFSDEQGLRAFSDARHAGLPQLVAAKIDTHVLRAHAATGELPAILHGLAGPVARRRGPAGPTLTQLLAQAPRSQWPAITLNAVIDHVRVVLGHDLGEPIDARASFKELGFDSLAAVEIRNRLSIATGQRLDATLTFDHPTPAALARHLAEHVDDAHAGEVEREIDRLELLIGTAANGDGERERIQQRLTTLLGRLTGADTTGEPQQAADTFETASREELFALIDGRWGDSG